MLSSIIAERYAKALLAAAEEAGQLDDVRAEAAALSTALDSDPQLEGALRRPLVKPSDKAVFFSDALAQRFSRIFVQFLRVVFENKRQAFLPAMLKQVQALSDQRRARARGEVASPFALKPAQLKAISAGLSERLGRQVELTPVVNRSMLGGLKVTVGDKVFDGSLETQLKRLEENLMKESVEAKPAAPRNAGAAKPKPKAKAKPKPPAAKKAPKKKPRKS